MGKIAEGDERKIPLKKNVHKWKDFFCILVGESQNFVDGGHYGDGFRVSLLFLVLSNPFAFMMYVFKGFGDGA